MAEHLMFLDANNNGVLWKSNGATASSTAAPSTVWLSPPAPVTKPGSGGTVDYGVLAVGSSGPASSDLVFWDGGAAPALLSGLSTASPTLGLLPSYLTPWNGTVYLDGTNHGGGQDLWSSNGTKSGTVPLTSSNLQPAYLAPALGGLFFNGQTYTSIGEPIGKALFSYSSADGAVEIPSPLGGASSNPYFNPYCLAASPIGSALYFPFIFLGPLGGFSGPRTPDLPVSLFMGGTASDGVTVGLYLYDGSAISLVDAGPASGGLNPVNLVSLQWITSVQLFDHLTLLHYNSAVFFSGVGGFTGLEMTIPLRGLWTSQGTAATTVQLYGGLVSGVSLDPYNLTPLNGTLYFTGADAESAPDGSQGRGLFAFNPVTQKTTHLFSSKKFDFSPTYGSVQNGSPPSGFGNGSPFTMTAFENKLYFNCIDVSSGQQGLYVWDPTKGTGVSPSLVSGTAGASPMWLTVAELS